MKVRPYSAGVHDSTLWAHAGQFRELADSPGINILRIHGGDFNFRLADSIIRQRTRIDQRLISASFGPDFSRMSIGREIRSPVIADDENMLVPR
jgi:hypothetical protein